MTSSRVREALDALLARHPLFDVVAIDWQIERLPPDVINQQHPLAEQGPWVLVDLGQRSENFDNVPAWAIWRYAIWKSTGALYAMRDGAVADDPFWTPALDDAP